MGLDTVEILLVEDNAQDAEMTLRALTRRRMANSIHHVKDGAEALAYIFAKPPYEDRTVGAGPKVVLLDLKLPKVSGLEVLQQIKADPRTQSLPVVVLTSSKEDRDLREAYKFGVNSYIVKPVQFESFLECVGQFGLYWLLVNKIPD